MTNQADAPSDLIVRGGLIVTAKRRFKGDIHIRGSRIARIGDRLKPPGHAREIDARGLLVFPGGIDPHVHLNLFEPSPPGDHWVDDLVSGSKAALAGGITTIGVMSAPRPGETLRETFEREKKRVAQQAIADVMLHPLLLPRTGGTGLLPPVGASMRDFPEGCTSVKVFMSFEAFDAHALDYLNALRAAGEMGILTMIHCEDHAIVQAATQALLAEGRGHLRYYAQSRPVVAEAAATGRAVAMCEFTDAPIYVVHLSSRRALQICAEAQARSLSVYVETRPIYLHFTEERYLDPDGPLYVGQPPLRQAHDVAALWGGLAAGTIHTIGSDHAPWTRRQKLDPTLNVARTRPGINDLQTMLPVLYSEGVQKGRLTPERFVALTSTNAARLFGLYPQKGTIAVGSDADLVLWDAEEKRRVGEGQQLFSRAGFSIYENIEVTGWPRFTIRRGQVVFAEERITAQPGTGRIVRRGRPQEPAPFPAA